MNNIFFEKRTRSKRKGNSKKKTGKENEMEYQMNKFFFKKKK